jgi:hypothetical protein
MLVGLGITAQDNIMTLQRNRIYITKDLKLDGETFGVFYYPKGAPSYSATRSFRFAAVFDSLPSESIENLFSWKDMILFGEIPEGSRVNLYIKSADTIGGLDSSDWGNPYTNGIYGEDISSITGNYISVRIVIESYSEGLDIVAAPRIDKLTLTAFTYGSEEKLFTKTFDLSFVPKHIVLTYNGDKEQENSLLQFALAGKESIEDSDYQTISPNKIVKLDKIPEFTQKVKLMVRALGSNQTPVSMDCFAITLGGDGRSQLNQ